MNKCTHSIKETKIRNVYLSDFNDILSIYKASGGTNLDGNTVQENSTGMLTEKFGLPFSLVECNKEIIGYAYVVVSTSNNPEIYHLFKPKIEKEEISVLLEKHAEKVLQSMSDANPNSNLHSQLSSSISRLFDWLNSCH